MINKLVKEAHENAKSKGWWEEERELPEMIALMHSELSEALEEYRKGKELNEVYTIVETNGEEYCSHNVMPWNKPEGIPIELADVIIRIFDACGRYGIDLEEAIKIKMAYNKTRSYKHGGKKI